MTTKQRGLFEQGWAKLVVGCDTLIGTAVGNDRIVDKLDEGGMGTGTGQD